MAPPATNADYEYAGPEGSEPPDNPISPGPPPPAEPFTSSTRSPFSTGAIDGKKAVLRVPRESAYRLCAQLLIGDWLAACAAIVFGLGVREWQRTGWSLQAANLHFFPPFLAMWGLCGGTLFLWMMAALKTYEVRNLYRLQLWSRNLAKSVIMWSLVAWACVGLLQVNGFAPRIGVLYCALALGAFAVLWRLISFNFLMRPEVREAASSRVIVVGWNERTTHLRKAMRQDIAQLSEIVGCVTMPDGTLSSSPPSEIAVLGGYRDLSRFLAECGADSIILSDVTCSADEIQLLVEFCQREMIGFQMVPDYFPALGYGLEIQINSGLPLLGFGTLPLDEMANRLVKRVMDIVGALVGLCVCAVVVPLFGALVSIESAGPLLRRESRASRSGRVFDIFKMRTGRIEKGRERPPGPLGRFIQTHDIDELPQFWNVLMGDMSLVGPRPERPEAMERLKAEIPNYSLRHEVRAGLTGWSQINGVTGDSDIVKRIEGDLYYLKHWNVMLDVYCIAATLFRPRSARHVERPRENA